MARNCPRNNPPREAVVGPVGIDYRGQPRGTIWPFEPKTPSVDSASRGDQRLSEPLVTDCAPRNSAPRRGSGQAALGYEDLCHDLR